jgi:isopropylmalate/homocitrate/citramalate synthase
MTTTNSPRPLGDWGRGQAFAEGRHFVSEFNFVPEVTSGYEIPTPLGLIDSTIRKVIYTVGVRPSEAELLEICHILEELGIEEESLNVWWRDGEPDPQELAAAMTIARAKVKFKVNVFTDTLLGNGETPMPLMKQTVDMFAEAGIKLLNPGLLQAPNDDARKRQADEMAVMNEYIKAAGMEWNATIANCGRRNFDEFMALCNTAVDNGVRRFDLMDSTSALSPQAMTHYVRTFRSRLNRPTPLTMHTHDDFGMDTAGTIAAVLAGASPDVALNGVSYRSGFAALEEVVVALDVLYGVDTGIRLDRLKWASDELARVMRFPVPPLKPVVGSHQFLREGPPDIDKILDGRAPADFANMGGSYSPELIGAEFHWVFSQQGNSQVVASVARSLGLTLTDKQVAEAVTILEAKLAAHPAYPRWATPDEVFAVVKRVAG